MNPKMIVDWEPKQVHFYLTIFDREYVVRRGLRSDFVVVVVVVGLDRQEQLYQICLQ